MHEKIEIEIIWLSISKQNSKVLTKRGAARN